MSQKEVMLRITLIVFLPFIVICLIISNRKPLTTSNPIVVPGVVATSSSGEVEWVGFTNSTPPDSEISIASSTTSDSPTEYPIVYTLTSEMSAENIINLMNHDRQLNNLSPLKENTALSLTAQEKVVDEITHNYFSHLNTQGQPVWGLIKDAGYMYTYAGENLAVLFSDAQLEEASWMASPEHRKNILNKNYTDVGVSVMLGTWEGYKTNFVVVIFGSK